MLSFLIIGQLVSGQRYGVRLTGGSGGIGRLEVRPADPNWNAFLPVCDEDWSRGPTGIEQVMCQLLGYRYGRQYYSNELNYRTGDASLTGPLVALECSPWGSDHIRLVGGGQDLSRLEPNLCNPARASCFKGRVEVAVPAPGGGNGTVWAPLCAPAPGAVNEEDLADMLCRQGPFPSFVPTHFGRPAGPVTKAGNFNPAKYAAWATVTGGSPRSAGAVQDLKMQVAGMFAMTCMVLVR
ncbi:hypothetical protein GPECTOR_178g236 [Gonium pectorale]|uniref:SRCR domain-containing protein n=1 Tax=Gonium pectorale TaxID=33097 RepID=A0A150FXC5_GONPE|nr:hypothetical protein GPECTOR_178g236 [Gonium pectorale]|eukprot:KXZ42227.1 hypothetical protein GPECTOR_178g236 [Gonium pectorale]